MIDRLRSLGTEPASEGTGEAGEKITPARAFVARLAGELAAGAPWRRFTLEVNPIKWSDERAIAVDGLLIIEQE